MRIIPSLLVLSLVLAARVDAQTVEAGPLTLKLKGRINYQFNTTSVDDAELAAQGLNVAVPSSTFELRRLRVGTAFEYEDWLNGEIELDVAGGRVQARNAFMNFGFAPAFQVRAGQFKKPFGLLQLTSSSTFPLIERGVRIRGLADALSSQDDPASRVFTGLVGEEQELLDQLRYQNYELGAEVHGGIGPVGYAVGVFNGTGSDRASETDDKSFAGRGTLELAAGKPLVLGVGLSRSVLRTGSSADDARTGAAWEADLQWGEFRQRGLRVLAEVTGGKNIAVEDANFLGAQGVVAFFQPLGVGQVASTDQVRRPRVEGVEFAGRASYGDPRRDIEGDEGLLLTPGVNVYFSGRNRLMLNWDIYMPESDRFTTQNALRAQAQVYF